MWLKQAASKLPFNSSTWKHLNPWSSCAVVGCSARGFIFHFMMLNLIQKGITSPILRDFNKTFTEYSLYTEVYRNDTDFI
jgi:hypothetical protein